MITDVRDKKPVAPVAPAEKKPAAVPAEKEPMPVTIVPSDGLTPAERESAKESSLPENVENRNASYLPPVEGVNQNDPDE